MGSELPSVIRPFPPAVSTASNPHRKGMAFPCRWLIPAVVDGNRCESPGSATVRRSRGIRCCPDGATPTCHPGRRGAPVRGPACRGPCGLRRQSGPRIESGATIGGPGRQCGPVIAAMSLNSKPLVSDPPRQPPVEPPHKAPRRKSHAPRHNRQGAMSGAILGRRDRTARPPRVEHYSAAVDTIPINTEPRRVDVHARRPCLTRLAVAPPVGLKLCHRARGEVPHSSHIQFVANVCIAMRRAVQKEDVSP